MADEVDRPRLTKAQARKLTERIREAVEFTYELVAQAKEQEAWKALGYKTWGDYVGAEFDMTTGNARRLILQAEANRAIGSGDPPVSARAAGRARREQNVRARTIAEKPDPPLDVPSREQLAKPSQPVDPPNRPQTSLGHSDPAALVMAVERLDYRLLVHFKPESLRRARDVFSQALAAQVSELRQSVPDQPSKPAKTADQLKCPHNMRNVKTGACLKCGHVR